MKPTSVVKFTNTNYSILEKTKINLNELNEDVTQILGYYICLKNYSLIDLLILINKKFNKLIKGILQVISKPETLFIATYIKNWRGEIDQKEYVYGEFMLSDKKYDIESWLTDTSQNIRKSLFVIDRELITLNTNVFNSAKFPQKLSQHLNWSEKEYNLEKYNKNSKSLLFEEYYVYYFYIDYCDCYCFDIYIYPYYDERLTLHDTFSHFVKIKKNQWHNHNIPKEYNGFDY